MTVEGQYVSMDASRVAAGIEEQLISTLLKTTRDIAHTECFDDEQRAEIYTILQAIRSDTQKHRQAVARWACATQVAHA